MGRNNLRSEVTAACARDSEAGEVGFRRSRLALPVGMELWIQVHHPRIARREPDGLAVVSLGESAGLEGMVRVVGAPSHQHAVNHRAFRRASSTALG